ncbi:MbeB family mobilization protein [Salmonella enterica]|nr:mobilization protein [Salmonella enterica]MBX9329657.1 MbeB family mobilization protein [Serratia marcescens]
MNSLLTLAKDLEQKSKAQQQSTGEMLKAAFSEHEQCVKAELNASAKRISNAISAHEQGMNAAMQSNRLNVLRMVGRTWLTVVMVSVLLIGTSGSILWWQGEQIRDHYTLISEMKRTEAMLSKKNNGVLLSVCGDSKRPCVKVNPEAGVFGEDSSWMILAGK